MFCFSIDNGYAFMHEGGTGSALCTDPLIAINGYSGRTPLVDGRRRQFTKGGSQGDSIRSFEF
jgi:hypothetical protein